MTSLKYLKYHKMRKSMTNYWIGEVQVEQGFCWTTVIAGNYAKALCLGKESDIVPVLKKQVPIPDNLPLAITKALIEILNTQESVKVKAKVRKQQQTLKSEVLGQGVIQITQNDIKPLEPSTTAVQLEISVPVKRITKTYTSNIIRFVTEAEARYEAKKLRRQCKDRWYDVTRTAKEYQKQGLLWQVREVSRR